MASSPEFKLVEKWINLLKKEAGAEAVNVIDLGCGDGKKAAHVIEHLKKAGIKVRYCPIDISAYMVDKAVETVSKMNVDDIVESKWNISDFENLENVVPLLVKGEFKKNLFLLLGYTLGNFEIHELLYAIKSAMSCGDLFVAVAGIGSSKWEERAKTAKDDKKTNLFFKHILLQLGMKKGDVEFGSRFKNSRIEFYYTIKNDKKIDFQDKSVHLHSGDQIIVAVAYKQEKDELLSVLNMHFSGVNLKVSEDGSTGLAICKKL
jgi:uncharacterized SAM-dependent methyltransferase